ncbi:type II toxin-antitoxin system HicA family toxin [Synechocystis sp. PCC 7339]|uniref:type II toxin-antitoxin system HicA family toxin n=1 Tax=unclassified Synechocystis TaxID=2640012 RepID=UPI001BB02A43|nr:MULTISPECIES: type II toxin-antitoxin system HicA family toxin [unclassified Synechocystis]QUS62163.1 type II toxin-antitoxin system HicA family toxin [Synechocystis sp. PCC 7338]UAJ71346.1 type II toxin-antitoxin system HicA family toxin [Synechocystis sp. PCC 7339]
MPKKIRKLKALLKQAGFTVKPAKGSHSKWTHPGLPQAIIMAGKDGDDAKPYLEKQVMESLAKLRKLDQEDNQG